MELTQMIKALSDDTRIRILNLLKEGDLCVCELEVLLNINQSNASRHLNKLTNAKLITYYKKAQYVYYKLVDETIKQHTFIQELLNKEMDKIAQCNDDLKRLKTYKTSAFTCEDLKQGKVCFNDEQ